MKRGWIEQLRDTTVTRSGTKSGIVWSRWRRHSGTARPSSSMVASGAWAARRHDDDRDAVRDGAPGTRAFPCDSGPCKHGFFYQVYEDGVELTLDLVAIETASHPVVATLGTIPVGTAKALTGRPERYAYRNLSKTAAQCDANPKDRDVTARFAYHPHSLVRVDEHPLSTVAMPKAERCITHLKELAW